MLVVLCTLKDMLLVELAHILDVLLSLLVILTALNNLILGVFEVLIVIAIFI